MVKKKYSSIRNRQTQNTSRSHLSTALVIVCCDLAILLLTLLFVWTAFCMSELKSNFSSACHVSCATPSHCITCIVYVQVQSALVAVAFKSKLFPAASLWPLHLHSFVTVTERRSHHCRVGRQETSVLHHLEYWYLLAWFSSGNTSTCSGILEGAAAEMFPPRSLPCHGRWRRAGPFWGTYVFSTFWTALSWVCSAMFCCLSVCVDLRVMMKSFMWNWLSVPAHPWFGKSSWITITLSTSVMVCSSAHQTQLETIMWSPNSGPDLNWQVFTFFCAKHVTVSYSRVDVGVKCGQG